MADAPIIKPLPYTYAQLLKALQELSPDQLSKHVLVQRESTEELKHAFYTPKDEDEADHAVLFVEWPEPKQLDRMHPYLRIQ